jgi:squalene synthase HpnC
MPSADTIRSAFAHCEAMARDHYENFPVASLLLPRRQRPFVAAIYAFARTADDFADEGERTNQERLDLLDDWGRKLDRAARGDAELPIFVAVAETLSQTGLPADLLADLLTAFRMDVTIKRYESFDDLLGYCRYSANPVGRLVLLLFGQAQTDKCELSDRICTGLQLANFWQDLGVDWNKGRLYVPLEDLRQFGYTEREMAEKVVNDRFRELMKFQVDRAREFLVSGARLPGLTGGRLRWELALTIRGGVGILRRIEALDFDVLSRRPAFQALDKARLLVEAIIQRPV